MTVGLYDSGGSVEVWWCGSMEVWYVWQCGSAASLVVWKCGKSGSMEVWQCGSLVVW